MNRVLLEVCTDSISGSVAAFEAGADRIELNSAMENGGLTPSIGLIREVIGLVDIPVVVMIRPRPGGFVYSRDSIHAMVRDTAEALHAGASGVAMGFLTAEGSPDLAPLEEMRRLTEGRELVFHRAFDLIPDGPAALEALISTGVDRLLTSGGAPDALQGAPVLSDLVRRAGGRLEVMPGSGITPVNAAEIVRLTGCREIHGSFTRRVDVPPARGPVSFPPSARETDSAAIISVKRNLDAIPQGI